MGTVSRGWMEFEWKKSFRKWRNTRGFEVVWMGLRAKIQDGRPEYMEHVEEVHWRGDGTGVLDGT